MHNAKRSHLSRRMPALAAAVFALSLVLPPVSAAGGFTGQPARPKTALTDEVPDISQDSAASADDASNNYLTTLIPRGETLIPEFSRDRLDYTVYVQPGTDGIYFIWKTEDPKATVELVTVPGAENAVAVIYVNVKAQNKEVRTYKVKVHYAESVSSDNYLTGLTVTGFTLSPAFASSRQEYSVSVPYATSALDVQWTLSNGAATAKVMGNSLTPDAVTVVTVRVTAQNGAVRDYVINASRAAQAKSSDNRLSSLSAAGFTLTPSFSPDQTDYALSVTSDTTKLNLSWTTADSKASTVITGNTLAENAVTPVTVTVTAENGAARSYVIKVTRPAPAVKSSDNSLTSLGVTGFSLAPAFSPSTLEYTVSVPYETAKLTLTYQASSGKATVSVSSAALAAGAVTPVTVTVTAENGAVRKYVIKADRAPAKSSDNRLASLSVEGASLTPAFSPDKTEYTVTVPSTAAKLVLACRAADPKAVYSVTGNTLAAGAVTPVTVTVTAENGETRKYVIKATRTAEKSAENRLESLKAAGYSLVPPFTPDRSDYTLEVAPATGKLDLTVKTSDPKATFAVTGNSLAANAVTPVTVKVTAENGSVRVYTIKVTRAPAQAAGEDQDSSLASLAPSAGTLSPVFSKTVMDYTLSLPAGQDLPEFTAVASSPLATVSASSGGERVRVFTVTARNGLKSVYSVTVTVTGSQGAGPGATDAPASEISVIGSVCGTMLFPAGQLNSLFRNPGSSATASNPVGQVIVRGDDISGVARPYYDLTLAYSTRHGLPELVPADALVVSTAFEGELFGQAEFTVFTQSREDSLAVCLWDPQAGALTLLDGAAPVSGGAVRFTSRRAGTFVITSMPVEGAGSRDADSPGAGFPVGIEKPILAAAGILVLFLVSYVTGTLAAGKEARARRMRSGGKLKTMSTR